MKAKFQHKDILILREKWLTTDDLIEFLKEHGYPCNRQSIVRWEKDLIIPIPSKKEVKKKMWRVYSKDGLDFLDILKELKKHTIKRVVKRLVKRNLL